MHEEGVNVSDQLCLLSVCWSLAWKSPDLEIYIGIRATHEYNESVDTGENWLQYTENSANMPPSLHTSTGKTGEGAYSQDSDIYM